MKLEINLFDLPTNLHKAGLAGLYLTLSRLQPSQQLQWQLTPTSITLESEGLTDKEAIEWLLEKSFQLDDNGLIQLTGLEPLTLEKRICLHQGITGTFLFHNRVVKSQGKKSQTLEIDDKIIEVEYKALDYYPLQDLKSVSVFSKKGNFEKTIKIASWLYPGGGNLHEGLGKSSRLDETPESLIALVFAPVGCFYSRIRSRLKQNKLLFALIIPEIDNLEQFAQAKLQGDSNLILLNSYASGLSDAGLKALLQLAGENSLEQLPVKACEVWGFGSRDWSKLLVITQKSYCVGTPTLWRCYGLVNQYLTPGLKVGKNGTFISVSFGREIAAESLIEKLPWYYKLAEVLRLSMDFLNPLLYERKELRNLMEKTLTGNGFAEKFVQGITSIYQGQLAAAKQLNSEKPNFDRVRERMLLSLRGVKTPQDFNRWFFELVSRSNNWTVKAWQGLDLVEFRNWAVENWEECLSLAALAVIAYKGAGSKQIDEDNSEEMADKQVELELEESEESSLEFAELP